MTIKIDASDKENKGRFMRGLYFTIGTFFLVTGGVGIFLPILPTTPFLLLAAACYYKSSRRMHQWMLGNKWFGSYLRNYVEGKGISLRAKLFSISLLWALMIYSVFVATDVIMIQIVLFSIAVGVSVHIAGLPTYKPPL